MQVDVSAGDHEIIFQPLDTNYYALRVNITVSETSIVCNSAEYGEYDPSTNYWTKVGNASCDVCTTQTNGVCVSGLTIHGYLKPKEEEPTTPTTDFDNWLASKGGCAAIQRRLDIFLEILYGYLGKSNLGFSVLSDHVSSTINCYLGFSLSASKTNLMSELLKYWS